MENVSQSSQWFANISHLSENVSQSLANTSQVFGNVLEASANTSQVLANASHWSWYERLLVIGCGSLMRNDIALGCKMIYYLVRTCPFVLLLVGTVGNLLNIAVLSRPQMKGQSTTVYLLFLACSDLLTLWITLSRSTLAFGWGIDISNLSDVTCATVEWITVASILFSLDLVVLTSVERMLLMKFPVSAKQKMTRRNAVKATTAVLVYSFAMSSPLIVSNTLNVLQAHPSRNGTGKDVPLNCNVDSQSHLYGLYNSSYLIAVARTVLSLTIIAISNVVLIASLASQRRRMHARVIKSMSPAQRATLERNKELARLAVMLAAFVIITTLPFTVYVYMFPKLTRDLTDERFSLYAFGRLCLYYAAESNCAINFFLYFGSGPMFKRELKAMWKGVPNGVRQPVNSNAAQSEVTNIATDDT